MNSPRIGVWLGVFGLACGSVPGEGRSAAVTPAADGGAVAGGAAPATVEEVPAAIFKTCPIGQAAARTWQLDAVAGLDAAAGKRWLIGRQGEQAVLLHVDAAGWLAAAPVPAWTEDGAAEAGALRLVRATAPPTWWSVDLRDAERPVVGAGAAIDAAAAGEYPKAFASDGTRALLAQYRVAAGAGRRYVGETYLLDVASGRAIGGPAAMTVWVARCAGGRCWGYATDNASDAAVIAGFGDDGGRVLASLGTQVCAGIGAWQQGALWSLVWAERGGFGAATVDVGSGEVRVDRVAVAGDPEACVEVEALAVAGSHGVVVGRGQERVFLPARGDRTFGAPEALPAFDRRTHALALFGDGVVVVDYAAESGLQHGPEGPDGTREYHHVWSFAGSHGFLRRDGGRWRMERGGPLPHSGEAGEFAAGYRVHVLTGARHAGVLLAGDAGLASAYVPVREGCP